MEFLASIWAAVILGIMTSISPCPLASNIAAVSFIGKNVNKKYSLLLSGILYSVGRALAYIIVGFLVVKSIISTPVLSHFLQKNMNKVIGPVLIIAGILLLELISFRVSLFSSLNDKIQARVEKLGLFGAAALGLIFALAFCPVSAAFFFGSLIPLAVKCKSTLLLTSVYGIGTALPVLFFAIILSFSAHYLGKVYNKLTATEFWIRRVAGGVFILIGIYQTYIFIIKPYFS